ncbi:hypothetical protein RSOLAG22IIIB_04620 [Rhizoctonia solani]|uniref:Uncharacterized protein n=1 Tax=Rhizoctonia solani TaxID=456999 RepID=A0A0K6FYS2_9AGAM|nr:hypothetical protein RSOLAG22IIIB_04620 [Rhizoctonia solani]
MNSSSAYTYNTTFTPVNHTNTNTMIKSMRKALARLNKARKEVGGPSAPTTECGWLGPLMFVGSRRKIEDFKTWIPPLDPLPGFDSLLAFSGPVSTPWLLALALFGFLSGLLIPGDSPALWLSIPQDLKAQWRSGI